MALLKQLKEGDIKIYPVTHALGVFIEDTTLDLYLSNINNSEIPSLDGYATEQWVEDKNYLTEHQDISHLASKEEIPSLDGYATEQWVENKNYLTEHLDISHLASKEEIPSLDGYATEQWVEDKNYLTEHLDISHLASKEELNSGLTNKQNTLISGTSIKTINGESILGEGDLNVTTEANIQAVDTNDEIEDVETNTYVKYVALTLTEEQKEQVRNNIGAVSAAEIDSKLGDINTILETIINGGSNSIFQ